MLLRQKRLIASAGALFFVRDVTINIAPPRGFPNSPQPRHKMIRRLAIFLILALNISAAAQTQPTPSQSLDSRIRAEVAPFKGKVVLYAKNLDTGQAYSFNGDERVRTASTIKIAVMIEAFARVAEGRVSGLTSWF